MKQLTDKQIEALWTEAETKEMRNMKSPMGFNGSGLWAVVALLVIGVVWIRHDFGPNMAGAAILGVFGILAFLAGQLTNLASRQVDGNQRIGEMQARAAVDRERIKAEGQIAKIDGQMQLKQFMFMVSLLKPLLTQAPRQPAPEIEEDGETIDLDAIRSWQWTERDL